MARLSSNRVIPRDEACRVPSDGGGVGCGGVRNLVAGTQYLLVVWVALRCEDVLMKLAGFEAIVGALNAAGVRYLVVGGVAVNAHGYSRFTKDLDLVVLLERENVLGAFAALEKIGYRPNVPITAEQFADPQRRESWRNEKGMLVLQFWSDLHRETPLDVFVYEPFDFDLEEERALAGSGADGVPARFASIPALIAMKQAAGRPQDLIDIEKLRVIAEIGANERGG